MNIQLSMIQDVQVQKAVGDHLYMVGGLVVAAMADQNKTPCHATPNAADNEDEQPGHEDQ